MKKRAYPLIKALFAWIENRPLPFGAYVIHEDIQFDFPSDIPLQVLSYITRLREEKETSDSLTVVVRHLKQAFKDLPTLCSQEPYHQEQPIYLYKTLGVLLNFTAQTTCSNLIPAVVSAISLPKDKNLPSEWQDELAEAFLYAVFQLAYHGCNESQKLKSAPISAGVNKFLSNSFETRHVSEKNYLIFFLLVCMLGRHSITRLKELIVELKRLELLGEQTCVVQHIKATEKWYRKALSRALKKDAKLLEFIKNGALQDIHAWHVTYLSKHLPPKNPRHYWCYAKCHAKYSHYKRSPSMAQLPRGYSRPLLKRYDDLHRKVDRTPDGHVSTLTAKPNGKIYS